MHHPPRYPPQRAPQPLFNLVTLQVTKSCNQNCGYCYLGNSVFEAPGTLPIRIVDKVLRDLRTYHTSQGIDVPISVTFHGGEPLLAGHRFYETVLAHMREIEREAGKCVFNTSVQTNMTLLDDDFCGLFHDHHVGISTSVDGPALFHNQWRTAFPGQDNHALVMEKINLARKHGLRVGAICLITPDKLSGARVIYEFFRQEGLSFKTNPVFLHGRALENADRVRVSEDRYSRFLMDLFDLWYPDSPKIAIENLSELMAVVVRGAGTGSCINSNCSVKHITITSSGDCYTCGRATQDPWFWLGNLEQTDVDAIAGSEKLAILLERAPDRIASCSTCEVAYACYAGCMYEAFLREGTVYAPDGHCESFRQLYAYVRGRMESDLRQYTRRKETNNGGTDGK